MTSVTLCDSCWPEPQTRSGNRWLSPRLRPPTASSTPCAPPPIPPDAGRSPTPSAGGGRRPSMASATLARPPTVGIALCASVDGFHHACVRRHPPLRLAAAGGLNCRLRLVRWPPLPLCARPMPSFTPCARSTASVRSGCPGHTGLRPFAGRSD
jgi:hypothetical protein